MSTVMAYLYIFAGISTLIEAGQWPPKRRVSYVLTCLVATVALIATAVERLAQ